MRWIYVHGNLGPSPWNQIPIIAVNTHGFKAYGVGLCHWWASGVSRFSGGELVGVGVLLWPRKPAEKWYKTKNSELYPDSTAYSAESTTTGTVKHWMITCSCIICFIIDLGQFQPLNLFLSTVYRAGNHLELGNKFHKVPDMCTSIHIKCFFSRILLLSFSNQVLLTLVAAPCCHRGSVFGGSARWILQFFRIDSPSWHERSRISRLPGLSRCWQCANHFGDKWTSISRHWVAIPWESPLQHASASSCPFFAADTCNLDDVDTLHGALGMF